MNIPVLTTVPGLKFPVKLSQIKTFERVITFSQKPWLKSYIDFNTDKRKVAKNEFEKAFFKLMNNSCFGKTMENLRGRVDIKFVTSNSEYGGLAPKHDRTVERKLASPLYDGHIIFSTDLTAIKMKKKSLVLNKPIYAGMCILDLSKLWMYQFHYDVINRWDCGIDHSHTSVPSGEGTGDVGIVYTRRSRKEVGGTNRTPY